MAKKSKEIHTAVRTRYAEVANDSSPCCGPDHSRELGYQPSELADLPDEAVMGLGCGNPVALADLTEGETVLDLGSGGGIDVFLAARRVGATGRVIGVDMTPEMLRRAEDNAARAGLDNVEFRHGLIEDLPVETGTVDVILSNCVINLAPDKAPVFAEAHRVLRPGGRLVVSDIVTDQPLSPTAADDMASWASCVAGALPEAVYLDMLRSAGFEAVEVLKRDGNRGSFGVTVRALKPG